MRVLYSLDEYDKNCIHERGKHHTERFSSCTRGMLNSGEIFSNHLSTPSCTTNNHHLPNSLHKWLTQSERTIDMISEWFMLYASTFNIIIICKKKTVCITLALFTIHFLYIFFLKYQQMNLILEDVNEDKTSL